MTYAIIPVTGLFRVGLVADQRVQRISATCAEQQRLILRDNPPSSPTGNVASMMEKTDVDGTVLS